MKRSEINTRIRAAESFFAEHQFYLPEWAHWTPEEWKQKGAAGYEVARNALGWDLTDFGSGDFERIGLLLFTVRNGKIGVDKKTYAEKIMVVEEEQVTPMHFHWHKMEDIINRGGGNLVIDLYNSDETEDFADTPVEVSIDGFARTVQAGGRVILKPGQSICLTPGLYHAFWGEPGAGRVLVGEVSMVNDDHTDNRFNPPVGRFPDIEEDEAPYRLLVNDYAARGILGTEKA